MIRLQKSGEEEIRSSISPFRNSGDYTNDDDNVSDSSSVQKSLVYLLVLLFTYCAISFPNIFPTFTQFGSGPKIMSDDAVKPPSWAKTWDELVEIQNKESVRMDKDTLRH